MNKRFKTFFCSMSILSLLLSGCAVDSDYSADTKQDASDYAVVNDSEDKHISDKKSLYKDEAVSKIETMYLTVSSGAESDHTNHTWEEINTYSVYDYEEMGVDRYKVNGLLQIGDEKGPSEDAFGYGEEVPNAIVCIRGQTSTRMPQKNYKIEIKKGKGKYKDQRTINLNKHASDISRFTNKMCFDLIKSMPDMISLRTQFVHLYVKDNTAGGDGQFHDYGLYTQVEQPNKTFLKHHGLDSNGQLYKINLFEFYQYEDVIKLKSDPDYDQAAFEERLEIKGDDDHSKLIAMLQDVNDVSIPIEDVMDKWFEEDNMLSWLAFHILVGNVDTQSRNTLLYSPLNKNTWYFISWDCDGAFERTKAKYIASSKGELGWENGVSNYWVNVLFSRVLKSKEYRKKLDDKINEFAAIMTEEKLDEMQNKYASIVKPYVYANPDVENAVVTEKQYKSYCEELKDEVNKNLNLYKESLEKPMPFYIGTPTVQDKSIVFDWDSSYSFEKEQILYDIEIANDYKFEKPIAHEEGLMELEYELKKKLAPGQYFVRVKAKLSNGKSQYAFDYYMDENSEKQYGVKCFYVLDDGTVVEDFYEE